MRIRTGILQEMTAADVFDYLDYRAFLADHYEERKARRYGFSYRSFARAAGYSSPNFLKLVVAEKRNLSEEMAQRFADACGLTGEAKEYFCVLVAFNQASDGPSKDRHYRALRRFRGYRRTQKLDLAQAAYHSQWFIPAVRELAACRGFRGDPAWIAARMLPPITVAQAREALEVLLGLGLLVKRRDGSLHQSTPIVATAEGVRGHHIAAYHRALLQRAAESIELVPREQRELGAVTLCISSDRLAELKGEVVEFRDSVLERYGADEDGTRVVQLGLQLFPLSKEDEET